MLMEVQQFCDRVERDLNGLVDELQIHLVAKLMGGGLRLFDQLGSTKLEQTRVLESPGVTHLRYRVVK